MKLTYILVSVIILVIIAYLRIKKGIRATEEFNRVNGGLNKHDFSSDKGEEHFSWDEVKLCLDNLLAREDFKQHERCPKCGLHSEQLVWVNYRSSRKSWDHLAGIAGPLSICPNCKIQVEFVCSVVS